MCPNCNCVGQFCAKAVPNERQNGARSAPSGDLATSRNMWYLLYGSHIGRSRNQFADARGHFLDMWDKFPDTSWAGSVRGRFERPERACKAKVERLEEAAAEEVAEEAAAEEVVEEAAAACRRSHHRRKAAAEETGYMVRSSTCPGGCGTGLSVTFARPGGSTVALSGVFPRPSGSCVALSCASERLSGSGVAPSAAFERPK